MASEKEKIKSDYLFGVSRINELLANSAGWGDILCNPEGLGTDLIFFYVYDVAADWTWMVNLSKAGFFEIVEKASSISMDDVLLVSSLIGDASKSKELDLEKSNLIAIGLSAYFSKTQTYQKTNSAKLTSHFVVIRYQGKDPDQSMLRPFAIPSNQSRAPIEAQEVKHAIKTVVEMDKQNHPEWFRK